MTRECLVTSPTGSSDEREVRGSALLSAVQRQKAVNRCRDASRARMRKCCGTRRDHVFRRNVTPARKAIGARPTNGLFIV